MNTWITDNLLSIITTLLGGTSLIGYVLERRKRLIEEKQLSADALQKMQDAYRDFVEHANTNYRELLQKYQELTAKYLELEHKHKTLEIELGQLKNLQNG